MIKGEINCKKCVSFKTCKFVERTKEYSNKMCGIFKYAEWNNLEELFYANAIQCQFFVGKGE